MTGFRFGKNEISWQPNRRCYVKIGQKPPKRWHHGHAGLQLMVIAGLLPTGRTAKLVFLAGTVALIHDIADWPFGIHE